MNTFIIFFLNSLNNSFLKAKALSSMSATDSLYNIYHFYNYKHKHRLLFAGSVRRWSNANN